MIHAAPGDRYLVDLGPLEPWLDIDTLVSVSAVSPSDAFSSAVLAVFGPVLKLPLDQPPKVYLQGANGELLAVCQ